MAGETVITIIGNLTADPELRTTGNGANVVNFTVASTPRTFNRQSNQWEDGQALFMRCNAWRELAEHCAKTLAKGMRVIVQGRLSQRSYQTNDGQQRTVMELTVDDIGPSLRYATAQVARQQSQRGFTGTPPTAQPQQNRPPVVQQAASQQPSDPWGAPADFGGWTDEPEF